MDIGGLVWALIPVSAAVLAGVRRMLRRSGPRAPGLYRWVLGLASSKWDRDTLLAALDRGIDPNDPAAMHRALNEIRALHLAREQCGDDSPPGSTGTRATAGITPMRSEPLLNDPPGPSSTT